jgi:hypothetical protein
MPSVRLTMLWPMARPALACRNQAGDLPLDGSSAVPDLKLASAHADLTPPLRGTAYLSD